MRDHTLAIVLTSFLICLCKAQLQAQNMPAPFSSQNYDSEEYEAQAQSLVGYQTKLYDYAEEPEEQRPYRKESQIISSKDAKKKLTSEEKEEEEKPDRLTLLLEQSRFLCDGKTTGYYADDTLACEVFHYCQDNQRHSWICPEGFTFHQVHLICMPPTGENICDESSKYHIVNDYLYKPINTAEHESKPNVTLKYSDRYYPENFYHDERQSYEEEEQQPLSHRQPIQVGFNNGQRKTPTAAPQTSPLPYRFSSQQPQQQVYRSPEEINIPLQQRRPQVFLAPSTPKYEEGYGYNK